MQKNIIIDDIEIDVASLYSITHQCSPGTCGDKQCCCAKYEICIDHRELSRIIGFMPDASRFAPHLGDGQDFENIFEEDGPDQFVIDTQEDVLCVFAYSDEKCRILCSLHSVALQFKLPPHEVKPSSCVTWPLAITEDLPLQVSIAEDALKFPCNNSKKNNTVLDPDVARIIRDMFGEKVLTGIQEAKQNQAKK